jgi:hypothetical protein
MAVVFDLPLPAFFGRLLKPSCILDHRDVFDLSLGAG